MPKSEYELMIEKRVAQKNKMINALLSEFREEVKDENDLKEKTPVKRKTSTTAKWPTEKRILPLRSSKRQSGSCNLSFDDDMLKFPENEEAYVETPRKKRRKRVMSTTVSPRVIPTPSEISEKELEKVADRFSTKIYGGNGTTCHQCRQKTLDMKTICRNEDCVGVRGQFCGPCLRNRYGETVRGALKDPDWQCPCCRSICNCSFCRTAAGLRVTGICFPKAIRKGFSNVKDYLEETADSETEEIDF